MPKKIKTGRPTMMDENTVNKLEQAFLNGATDIQACFCAGISKQTLYNYQKKNPEFVDRKEALKSNLGLIAKTVIANKIKSGDTNDARWYLERKEPEEFSAKQKVEQRYVDKEGNDLHAKDLEILKNMGIV